ncbi:MAG TPA: OmpA family protein [Thermodesulfobacteriota bacterium]|nr:OmpA family protein [Thermodesulfobacteriota bacterium]
MKQGRNVLFAWIVLCLLSGCGAHRARRDLIVLLPDSDGKTGVITVTTKGGSQTLYKPGYSVEIGDLDESPVASKPADEKEIADLFTSALSALPNPASRLTLFILYFERDTTRLTRESSDVVVEVEKTIKNLKPNEVYIVGHTDLVGTEAHNDRLSSRRAVYVRDLLVASGIKPNSLFVSFYGKARPLVPTKDEVPEPRNRRVEVIVR